MLFNLPDEQQQQEQQQEQQQQQQQRMAASFRLVKPSGRRRPRTAAAAMPLSTCDLALPNVYAMAIFAFETDRQGEAARDFVKELETGLADALDEYPEWAGRLRHKDYGSSATSSGAAAAAAAVAAAAGAAAAAANDEEEDDDDPAATNNIATSNFTSSFTSSSSSRSIQGQEQGQIVIDFTDHGVALMEASMLDVCVRDLMPFDPCPMLFQLVPATQSVQELLLIQVTRFKCGGIVLGVAWHHRLADGQAFFTFMDNWARITRGVDMLVAPFHDRSALAAQENHLPLADDFRLLSPQNTEEQQQQDDQQPPQQQQEQQQNQPLIIARKFHFSSEELEKLRNEASLADPAQPATRFESLTAHLWRCITRARALYSSEATQILIALDARNRLHPALPPGFFGNATFAPSSESIPAAELLERPLSHAAALVHSAVAKADHDYLCSALQSMQIHQQRATDSSNVLVPPAMSPDVCVSSWVRFPLYDVDFGWGTPLFVGNVLQLLEGILVLLPSHTRDDSIDAVVALYAPDMDRLELQFQT